MNFDEMVAELQARGFDDLSDTRAGRIINAAVHEVEEAELWPFREDSATGTAPLQIADLGTVETVVDSSNSSQTLEPIEWSELAQSYGDLSTDGTPVFWYLGWPAGVPTVATFPESSHTIGVQYFAVSGDLSGTETPLVPERFHSVILNVATREAYRDSDNHGAAEAMQAQIERDLQRMRNVFFTDQVQGPGFVRIVSGSFDS